QSQALTVSGAPHPELPVEHATLFFASPRRHTTRSKALSMDAQQMAALLRRQCDRLGDHEVGAQSVVFEHGTRVIATFPRDDAEQVGQCTSDLGEGHENGVAAVHESLAEIRGARIGVGHRHVE
ncbi:MAG: hypothetical protein ACK55I_36555, partial [bacterium]